MGARVYDLTNDRWIDENSGMKPVSGGAADLRQICPGKTHKQRHDTVLRSAADFRDSPQPVPSHNAAGGNWADAVIDFLTVVSGLLMFGMIALFFLVIA